MKRDISYFLFFFRETMVFARLKDAKDEARKHSSWCIVRRDWNKGTTAQEMDSIVEKSETFNDGCFFRSGIAYLKPNKGELHR